MLSADRAELERASEQPHTSGRHSYQLLFPSSTPGASTAHYTGDERTDSFAFSQREKKSQRTKQECFTRQAESIRRTRFSLFVLVQLISFVLLGKFRA